MTKNEHIQSVASEFSGDEKKLINKISDEQSPDFKASEEFKSKLDAKLQDKIQMTKEQKEKQAALDAVPKSLRWRFYLTGYGYAVCTFLVLFLIGFCTNIFTGTLKVPTKYNYIAENQAFGNIDSSKQLAYDYDVNRVSNYSYDSSAEYDESIEESMDAGAGMTNAAALAKVQTLGTTMTTTENFAINSSMGGRDDIDILMDDGFTYNQTYRFAYKDKLFPKLNTQYPVYKSNGILMGSKTPNQVLKNLKIGNVSFKNFQDLDIMNIEMEQSVENGYNISFDNRNMKLDFYPNSSWKATQYSDKLPTKKQILKNTEKDLKNLGITLKNYGEGEVNFQDYDDNMGILQIFYPFIIEGKTVRNAESDQQIGMEVAYDLNLQKVVSVIGIDISTYDVSNYPTLDKKTVEGGIEKGGEYFQQGALHENSTVILFDQMEVVYTQKIVNGSTKSIMYVPTIRATVSTSLENYVGPSTIYEEMI